MFHVFHPDLFDCVTKIHKLVIMRWSDIRREISAVFPRQLHILPSLRNEFLENRINVIISFVELEKGH